MALRLRPLLLAALAAALAPPAALAAPPERLLVGFAPGTGPATAQRVLERAGLGPGRAVRGLPVRSVRAPAARGAAAVLRRDPAVRYVEPDAVARPAELLPDDPFFPAGSLALSGGAWGWGQTRATQVWERTTGAPDVVVAIVDTGLKPQGLDLAGQTVAGWNAMTGTSDVTSGAGDHGTKVAGVVGLAADSGAGGAGVCPGCRLMPVQVGTDGGGATYADLASGITWAADHGARVINVSMAGTTASSTLASAVDAARRRGAVVLAAAGNAGCDCPSYPAATPGVLGVAGTTSTGAKTGGSNFGQWVALAAPESNMTAWPSLSGAPGYAPAGGTSLATPLAAGIAGLLHSADPARTGAEVEAALTASATPASFVRHGAVDALAALRALGHDAPQPAGVPVLQRPPRVLVQPGGSGTTAPLTAAPQPGQVLVRGAGGWRGAPPLSLSRVRWERCPADGATCTAVGTGSRYTVQSADAGHALRLTVTVSNGAGAVAAAATPTAPVGGTVAPAPEPEPDPTPAPTEPAPAPAPAEPATVTQTFTGAVGGKSGAPSFSLAAGAGATRARLTFAAKCGSLTLALRAGSTALGSATGPSVLALDAAAPAGTLTWTVSGGTRCGFSLEVTASRP